jgi:hypothetical protein
MDMDEIIVHGVQRNGAHMVLDLLKAFVSRVNPRISNRITTFGEVRV